MNNRDVVPGRAHANAARREAHALALQPAHRRRERVDPQPDMVEPYAILVCCAAGLA